jgi:hypothetical protein
LVVGSRCCARHASAIADSRSSLSFSVLGEGDGS